MQQFPMDYYWLRRSAVLLVSLCFGLWLAAGPVQAATITVTTTADSGPGSLRQAIADAAWGDTITFALPNPSTITLNFELGIAKSLTIQGPGAAALTISGPTTVSAPTRLFFINPGRSSATSGPPVLTLEVTIANLTLANGYARGVSGNANPGYWVNMGGGGGGGAGMGGAIFSNKSVLTIRGVIFRANRAQGGTSGSNVVPNQTAPGFGGGGMGSPSVYGAYYGVDGGALGGKGGAVADGKLEGQYNGGLGPIGYPGGEGAGGGGGYPNNASLGGVGGFGGGGGGGGGIGPQYSGTAGGPGGGGGFGGGGGGGGGVYQNYGGRAAGGAGGQFGGKGGTGGLSLTKGAPGGGGAGLGGAIFVRAGKLTVIDSSFLNNSATGGQGYPEVFAGPGQGKGGAIFILTTYNGQSTGASLDMSGCATFSGNSAANAAGSNNDNNDLYGVIKPALPACAGAAGGAVVAADTSAAAPSTTAIEATLETTAQSQQIFLPLVANNVAAQPPLASADATGTQTSAVDATVVTTTTLPAVDPGTVAPTAPLSTTAAAAAVPVTVTGPVSAPAVVEAAPVVTQAVPTLESTPVVSAAPAVTTTQPVTPNVVELAPANPLAGTAVGGSGAMALLVVVGLVVAGGLVWRRRSRTR